MTRCDVIVVGAGPAGLAAAQALSEAGRDIVVFEAADHPGGLAWSERKDGYLLETGPHTFRGESEQLWGLLERLGLAEDVARMDAQAARYILRDGRLFRVPRGPLEFLLSGLLSPGAKWRGLLGLMKAGKAQDRSVAQWTERRFGTEIRRALVEPMVGGIFASDSAALDMARAFPRVWKRAGSTGRLLPAVLMSRTRRRAVRHGVFALRGGFGQLAEALANQLGSRLRLGQPVTRIEPGDGSRFRVQTAEGTTWKTDHVVLATQVGGLQGLLSSLLPNTGTIINRFASVPMASVSLGGVGDSPLPTGFGALIPRGEGFRMLGVLNVSAMAPERAPQGHWLLTAYLGGRQDPHILDLSDTDLQALVQNELSRLGRRQVQVSMGRVHRHPRAIPQPNLESSEALEQLHGQVAGQRGLHLAGSYLEGVSVEAAVQSGLMAADRVNEALAA